jgi:DNA repair photolyase
MQVSTAGYFSSFTDPFLPLEEYYHNTERGAQAFVDAGLPIFFLSRLSYPDWAYDLLRLNKYSYAQKSINTPDPETWHRLSPGAITLDQTIAECKELHDAGIYVSIQCNPIIPGVVTHDDVEELFEKLAANGVDHVIVKFVEAGHAWAKAMVERIAKKFPGPRSDRFKELFVENQCGGQKTVVESYRREGHARYQKKAMSLGMTYALCYEYTQKPGGLWKSMGPEFLTADQCHGHRVPMFQKSKEATQFAEMEICPPSGCLRCGDGHEESLCGSETLTAAKALRLPDFRNPWVKSKTITLHSV